MEITLTANRAEVFREVAQTTSYSGAKMSGDDGAYERISTVDEDADELQRFWDESRAEVAQTILRRSGARKAGGCGTRTERYAPPC